MNRLLQDVKYALRGIMRWPLLSIAVVAALATGIGLNASIFAILDGALLRGPVEKDPASFVQAIPTYSGWFDAEKESPGFFTVKDYDAIRARTQSLTEVAGSGIGDGARLENETAKSQVTLITPNFFRVYNWQMRLGRPFLPGECATPGGAPVVVISEGLWKRQYSSDPHIIGKRIQINGRPFTVVGVASSSGPLLVSSDLWVPYTMQAQFSSGYDGFKQHPNYPWIRIVGRLKPGYSQADAHAELQLIETQQDRYIPGRKTAVEVTNGSLYQDPSLRSNILVFFPLVMGPMILILLVACTNVTMLLLSRAAARRSEVAIRLALGAGRGRLLRMLTTEGLSVAAMAGAVSLYLTYRLPGILWAFLLRRSDYEVQSPDWVVFAFLAVATLLAGCMAGLAPGRESLKVDLVTSLKGREGSATTRSRTRSFLIVAQMAMSFVLVVAGVLFARRQRSITSSNPGFETRDVFLVSAQAPDGSAKPESAAFYRAVRDRVSELPGVRSASYASNAPFSYVPPQEVRLPGETKGHGRQADVLQVSTDYFATLGIPIVRGRAFDDSDANAAGASPVAVVSQTFAENVWPRQDPLGKVVQLSDNTQLLIVGVARDTKGEYGVPDGPRLYVAQSPKAFTGPLLVRFDGEERSVAAVISKAIRDQDSTQAAMPQTLRSLREDDAENIRPLTQVILFMASVALVLALSGVYGVVAFSMSQRTREFGIRMVLGATKDSIVYSVLASGLRQIGIGLFAGVVLVLPTAFFFRNLGGMSGMFDWRTYAISGLLLTVAALCAYYVPTRRAMKVDPMVALRYE